MPPKIVIYGDAGIPANQLTALHAQQFDVSPIPESYPADRLDFLGPFNLVILNAVPESAESLERVRLFRRHFSHVPLIMATANPSAAYLVQAYRNGITDCLLAPFNDDQLAAVVSTYLEANANEQPHALGLVPEIFRQTGFWKKPEKEVDLYVQFLGTLKVSRKGKRIDLPGGHRQRSLLGFLLYHCKTPVHRDRIISHFWPDHGSDCAKNNLNVGICNLRKHLDKYFPGDVICFRNEYFFLNPELSIRRDVDDFLQHYNEGKKAERHHYEQEAATWFSTASQLGSEFLEEFRQEDWTVRAREEFVEKYFHALDYLGTYQLSKKNYDAAVDTLRMMLYKDDCLESVHRKIMACYLEQGKKEKAVRQYQECARILQEKLDMHPSAETQELHLEAKG